ncbi:MAG: hypothetical protein NZ528_12720 [Caldilineales bacterium]|nr:hypothetical protein [Caldilineales bacterium]
MNTEFIALILSGINLIVFLVSVIFLYRQIRQIDRSIRGNTYQTLIYDGSAISRIFVDNPELADLWGTVEYVGRSGDHKQIRQAWVITMMMDHYENIFFQHEQGCIPDEMWERWARHISNVFTSANVQAQWSKARDVYYGPFREFVDRTISEHAQSLEHREHKQNPIGTGV